MSSVASSGTRSVARSGRQSVGSVVPVQSCAETFAPPSVRPQRPMPTTFGSDAATCFTHAESATRFPRNFSSSPLETTCPSVWFSRAVLSSRRCSDASPPCRSSVERSIAANGSFGSDQRHFVAVGIPDASSHDSNDPPSKKFPGGSAAAAAVARSAAAARTDDGKRGKVFMPRSLPERGLQGNVAAGYQRK